MSELFWANVHGIPELTRTKRFPPIRQKERVGGLVVSDTDHGSREVSGADLSFRLERSIQATVCDLFHRTRAPEGETTA